MTFTSVSGQRPSFPRALQFAEFYQTPATVKRKPHPMALATKCRLLLGREQHRCGTNQIQPSLRHGINSLDPMEETMKITFLASVAAVSLLAATNFVAAQGAAPGGTKEAPAPKADTLPPPKASGSQAPAVKGDAKPAAADTKPATGQPKPAAADTKSAPGETKPAAADTKSDAAKSASAPAAAPPPEKRSQISTTIKQQKVQEVTNVNFNISIGTRVPSSVRYNPLPSSIVAIYPEWRGYYFILVKGRYLILRPQTYEIVYIIEG